jgi:sialidase-1
MKKYQKSSIFENVKVLVICIASVSLLFCSKKTGTQFIDIRNFENTKESDVVKGLGYFPVIVGLPSDEVLVVLRGGAPHIGIGGRLDLVRSSDDGETWSKPQVIVDSDKDDRNPSFGLAVDGTLVLAYHWQAGYDENGKWSPGPYKQETKVCLSHDGGNTWEEPMLLNIATQRGNSPFGKMFNDANGKLYMPIYGAKNTESGVRNSFDPTYTYLITSTDNGKTWDEVIEVAKGFNEADYLILPNDEWLCAVRSQTKDEQAVYVCRSKDSGRTWSQPKRVTEAREHPPDLIQLSDGTILLIFGVRHEPYSIQGMVSRDFGVTWLKTRLLLADNLPGTDIGYPSTVRLKNGKLITVYYRAGSKTNQGDGTNPACLAICYDEKTLLNAIADVD